MPQSLRPANPILRRLGVAGGGGDRHFRWWRHATRSRRRSKDVSLRGSIKDSRMSSGYTVRRRDEREVVAQSTAILRHLAADREVVRDRYRLQHIVGRVVVVVHVHQSDARSF